MENYKFGVTGQERKSLVGAISEILNTPVKYLGMPTAAYEVGEYYIDKSGTVTGEYDLNLFVGLAERGFEPEKSTTFYFLTPRGTLLCQKLFATAQEAEADGYAIYFTHNNHDVYIKKNPDGLTEHSKLFALVGEPFDQTEPESEPETDLVSIEMPLEGFTPETISNLQKMVLAKEELIKKAVGAEELPIEIEDDKICFPWFRLSEDNGEIAAYSQFIAALCATAKEKKRVTAKAQSAGINDKFRFRVFMTGLGMIGSEYKEARKILLSRLEGNSAWLSGIDPRKVSATEESEVADDE